VPSRSRWSLNFVKLSSILIHDGKAIVTPGGKNCIVALTPETGETVWTSRGLDVPAEHGSCIATERDDFTLLVGVTSGGSVAVRADNGQSLWPVNITGGGSQDHSTLICQF
jgi:outer membrane protein assembly factor BamB